MDLSIRAARRHVLSGLAAVGLAAALSATAQAQTELKVGYMKHPIQDASLDMMDKWAKANNVKLTRVPMAYNIFMEKVTATLTSGNDQFDLIWHNDDWGPLWAKWLEPTDDVKGLENMSKWPLDASAARPLRNPYLRRTLETRACLGRVLAWRSVTRHATGRSDVHHRLCRN